MGGTPEMMILERAPHRLSAAAHYRNIEFPRWLLADVCQRDQVRLRTHHGAGTSISPEGFLRQSDSLGTDYGRDGCKARSTNIRQRDMPA